MIKCLIISKAVPSSLCRCTDEIIENLKFKQKNNKKYQIFYNIALFTVHLYVVWRIKTVTERNRDFTFLCKIYGTISLSFTVKLHVYFICPIYITTIFTIHKLKFCLWNKNNTICYILKITHKTETNKLTYTSISWNDIKAFAIYRNNEYAWHQVLLLANFPVLFGKDRTVIIISARCFDMILHNKFLCLSKQNDFL